jgi:3-hydroxybutyryl-CoA dehydrogenase
MSAELIGVVGLGLLGRGIATCLLGHGFRVIVYDAAGEQSYARAREYIRIGVSEMVDNAGVPESLRAGWPAQLSVAASTAELGACTFVLESVAEDLAAKQRVYDELEAAVETTVPIASNTSALPIRTLQQSRKYPGRFLGMHWAEPAYATRFLELIATEKTSAETIEAALSLARRSGKEPTVLQKDLPGFIVNRLGYAMYREALALLEAGVADAETIDRSFRNACGLWASLCGPFRWIDITGGPALYARAMSGVLPTLDTSPEVPKTLARMCDEDYRGTLDGRGFYSYRPGDAERWNEVLHRQAWAILRLQREMDAWSAAAGVDR